MRRLVEKYALGVVIAVLLILLIDGDLFTLNPYVIAGQLLGLALTLTSRAMFRKQQFRAVAEPGSGPLVQRGPYKVIRHPVYTGVVILIWATILGHPDPLNLVLLVIVTANVVIRITFEEQLLRQKYPEFAEYARHTKRMIPFIW